MDLKIALWLVDCACLVPMQSQPRAFARAFEFRRHNAESLDIRIHTDWVDQEIAVEAFTGGLGFEPTDLPQADLSVLCAACRIDHSIGPVAHTPGGPTAGYARWERFKRDGLSSYHRWRNDAAADWPRGVSRLSPYLHHGHVSPFRIAREARAAGGPGAEKFLDELLIWREVAHNFCFFTENPEHLEALPDWARETLQVHADDRRGEIYDAETLARGETGDPLWNLAQRSLLIHGELHNNLRMTWAKCVPGWTPSPTEALRALVDLNHRHALDGSAPNSYGGLLWALGLFDRPFKLERPVSGVLRSRSSNAHAERLDMDRYAARVCAPASGSERHIAVIGAGISGLAAARTLQDQGHRVTVFEKSKGRGGRAGTRRVGELGVDHGAQYFTARDHRFGRAVQAWEAKGIVANWRARIGVLEESGLRPSVGATERWVAVPGMSRLGGHLAEGLQLRLQTRVRPPKRSDRGWCLYSEEGVDLGEFDTLLVSAPAPQAVPLLAVAPTLAEQAASVHYSPCWAVMLAFPEAIPCEFDGLFCNQGPLRWIARNGSKPGRNGHVWLLHASGPWTRANLEAPVESVVQALSRAFAAALDMDLPAIAWSRAHRWLYALVENPLEGECLWDPELRMGACGDWAHGSRIEGAYLSGIALAGRVLGTLTDAWHDDG